MQNESGNSLVKTMEHLHFPCGHEVKNESSPDLIFRYKLATPMLAPELELLH